MAVRCKQRNTSNVWLDKQRMFHNVARQCLQLIKSKRYMKSLKSQGLLIPKALRSASGMVGVARFIRRIEGTVPYTNRKQFVMTSSRTEMRLGKRALKRKKNKELRGKILPAEHPKNVRVRMVTANIINGLYRTLDVPMYVEEDEVTKDLRVHRVSNKDTTCKLSKRVRRHIEGMQWEVLVVEDPAMKAFSCSEGTICVYTGMFESYATDAEIAYDIAHEVGHLVARHVAEKRTMSLWYSIQKTILSLLTSPDDVEEYLVLRKELPLLRRMEYEADYIGTLLMASAGYDPRIAPQIWRKRAIVTHDDDEDDLESTHPACLKRARFLEQEDVMNKAMKLYREALKEVVQ